MQPWLIVSAACLAALAATIYALFRGGQMARAHPVPPTWLLPSPVDVRHERFPLVWQGYDPAHVDVFVDALAAAYEELYFASGPTVVARARARLEARLGVISGEPHEGPRLDPVLEERPAVELPPPVRPVVRPGTPSLRAPVAASPPSGQELEHGSGYRPGIFDG